MTKEEFQKLTERVLILDGATGSNLIAAGMPRGVCAEKWILEHEEVLMELQRAYVNAGSQVVLAPTFGGNRTNLTRYGLQDQARELNHRLVDVTKRAVDGKAYVAGDITTGGKILGADAEATYENALENYREQISYLKEAGVDLLIAETMINIDETIAAVEAAGEVCDLPILCSMTVEADGTVFSGGSAREAAMTLQEMGASAVGINCSVGPDQLEAVVSGIKEIATVPVLVKPNAGMPTITEKGEARYSMNAEDFAEHMMKLIERGAGVVGGCCGTTPEFIRALCQRLR
ncbi:MAG: homocysteine S-methyltransferase family protein [Eubacteriales bacterium]|nr:homocysteine S-methyltransferase family protein [Eubacteriales bacterium]